METQTTTPGIYDDVPMVDPLGYIVFNNPYGVQKVLYDLGFHPAEDINELFALAQKVLSMSHEGSEKIWSAHPDKETILKRFAPKPENLHRFSLCNLCKSKYSSFSQEEADGYMIAWTGKSNDALHAELNRLKQVIYGSMPNNTPEGIRIYNDMISEINEKIVIISQLLGITPEGLGTLNQSGSDTGGNNPPNDVTKKNWLDTLSTTEKMIGAASASAIVILAIWGISARAKNKGK